ncbi:MAG: hypothetical protein V1685_07615 [Parcubacteria group bacterium]
MQGIEMRCKACNNPIDVIPEFCSACDNVKLDIDAGYDERMAEISKKYEDRYFAALALLREIVYQYDSVPDGPLSKGFTNAPFLAARDFVRGDLHLRVKPAGWYCARCKQIVSGEEVTFEEHHDKCGGKCS